MSKSPRMLGVLCIVFAATILACSDSDGETGGSGGTSASGGSGGTAAVGGAGGVGGAVPFALTSPAFAEGEVIPTTHECGPPLIPDGVGDNVSPALDWTAGPPVTQSYALVMRDIDAGNLVHWVVYDIPATARALPEGIPNGYLLSDPAGAKQAELQGAVHAYLGPCSANSVNTYQLSLHALDLPELSGVDQNTPETELATQIEGLAVETASLSGES